jgi:oligopeptide transport system substrate-binding protein
MTRNKFFFVCFLFLLGACTKRLDPKDNTFYSYVREEVRSLDPIIGADTVSHQVSAQIYEGLFHFHYLKRPIELEPLLAESFPEISKDGKTYTFKIRKNVHFQDSKIFKDGKGRELHAQDFIYSWKRLADPRNKSENFWVFQDRVVGFDEWRDKVSKKEADYDTPIEGFRTPDDHTLVIELKKPYPQLLYVLAMGTAFVVPHEAIEFYGKEFTNHAVGTGPFILDNWVRGSRITLSKNPNYREVLYPKEGEASDLAAGYLADAGKSLPLLDKVVIYEISQEQPRWLMFLKGDLDFINVSKDYVSEMMSDGKLNKRFSDKGISIDTPMNVDVTYVCFNNENPFLKNKKLRQALSLAYDNRISFEKFYAKMAVIAHGPIPPTVAGYRKDLKSPYNKFDLQRAKKLLAEAGYPEGKGLPEFNYEMASSHATARQMGEFFKQQMALLGVRVRLSSNTWPQFSEKVKKKKADIFDMAWNGDYPDAENFLQLFYSKNASPGSNAANFKNKAFDELYESAIALPLGPARTRLYEKMEDIIVEEVPWIFGVHRIGLFGKHPWLHNFKSDKMIVDSVKYYQIDGAERVRNKEQKL